MGFEDVTARKIRARDEAIERLQSEARERGELTDRTFWSMVYDFEMAPMTTNRRQLSEIGIEVPPSITLTDDELAEKLAEIRGGLERLHVSLMHSDRLPARTLYERLEREVLDEEVRDVPPLEGVREFVDLLVDEGVEDIRGS